MLNFLYRVADRLRRNARRRRCAPDLAAGRDGEDLAHRYLQRAGMTVIARNFRTMGGSAEVDLIARHGETLVFVEVKARRTDEFGAPERAIDPDKQDKIVRAARQYLRRSGHDPARVRFDIVAIIDGPGRREITHLPDAWLPRWGRTD